VPADRLAPHGDPHDGLSAALREFAALHLPMPEGRSSLGFVVGLDYKDPMFDPHVAFNHYKRHPLVSGLLEAARWCGTGAKALPEGGWYHDSAVLRDGALIVGDAPAS